MKGRKKSFVLRNAQNQILHRKNEKKMKERGEEEKKKEIFAKGWLFFKK